eukprot:m.94914 g.94914  ORF g.94914 m.94914 type:complete len:334 (+) comp13879_c0_seq1:1388-2389(+)
MLHFDRRHVRGGASGDTHPHESRVLYHSHLAHSSTATPTGTHTHMAPGAGLAPLPGTAPSSAANSGVASPAVVVAAAAASLSGTPTLFDAHPVPPHHAAITVIPMDRARSRRATRAAADLSRLLGTDSPHSPLARSPDVTVTHAHPYPYPYPSDHHAMHAHHTPATYSPLVGQSDLLALRLPHQRPPPRDPPSAWPSPLQVQSPALVPIQPYPSPAQEPQHMAVDTTSPVGAAADRAWLHCRVAPASKPNDASSPYTPEALQAIPYFNSAMGSLSLSESPSTTALPFGEDATFRDTAGAGIDPANLNQNPPPVPSPLTVGAAESTSGCSDMRT